MAREVDAAVAAAASTPSDGTTIARKYPRRAIGGVVAAASGLFSSSRSRPA